MSALDTLRSTEFIDILERSGYTTESAKNALYRHITAGDLQLDSKYQVQSKVKTIVDVLTGLITPNDETKESWNRQLVIAQDVLAIISS